ncbi:MAG: Zn-ribbon domain-containing OB-fold protein [Acidimicrobiales bacterium]
MITSIGTYLPPWGAASQRSPGIDEDVVTMAVAAGIQALGVGPVATITLVVLVSREFPLLEGGNTAPLLAGLGLSAGTEVREQLGGAPAALEAVTDASPGTLVIGADATGGAGAAAVLCGTGGAAVDWVARVNRSLPVVTRNAQGEGRDYGDPRLLRERGLGASLAALAATGSISAVAGLGGRDAAGISPDASTVPTSGASSALFALAAIAEGGQGGRVLAVEQATISVADLAAGPVTVARDERAPLPVPTSQATPGPDIAISLPAYERAFDPKLRLEAARCTTCALLSYPPRFRCLGCGSEEPPDSVALPREALVYTMATVRVPVPGLTTPYTLVLVELGATGVRLLVQLTGSPAGATAIGDTGVLVFRRVAERSGVPDYGYGFLPGAVAA